MTRFELLRWRDMAPGDRAAWAAFRAADRALRSPYFALGWLDAVDAARGDLVVLRGSRNGRPIAFLPVHARAYGLEPAGGPLCDWHGFVAAPDADFSAREALGSRFTNYRFSAAPASDRALTPFTRRRDVSPLIDLSDGFAAYLSPKRGAAPRAVRSWRRGLRKLDQAGKPWRFVLDDPDPEVLGALLRMKSAQLRRTGKTDVLSYRWARRLIECLMDLEDDAFRGMLSSLWIGDRLAAAHLGIRSGPVLHYWAPAHEREFSAYSPGMILMGQLAEHGAADGIAEIDLGPGLYRHKRDLANGAAPLIAGVVHGRSLSGRASAVAHGALRRWERLPLGALTEAPRRILRRSELILARFAPGPEGGAGA